MVFRAKNKCPQCQGVDCRRSRWQSVEEKRSHPGCQPYRCNNCSHRFMLPDEAVAVGERKIPLSVAAVAVIVAVFLSVVLTLWLARPDSGIEAVSAESTASLQDPELKIAAEAGDAGAQFRLGEAMLQQPGRAPETSEAAMRWLRLSAENGNTEAMIVLGRLSRTGVGILQNFGESARWLQVAATRGNPEGMLEYGRLYRDGVGVDKDLVRAYVWFNRASAARNLDAVRERELITRALTPEQLTEAQKLSSVPDELKTP